MRKKTGYYSATVTMLITLLLLSHITFVRGITVGTSMEPTIKTGNILWLYRFPVTPEVGDIIQFQYNSTHMAIHRVKSIEGNIFTTQGDNNPYPDQPIDMSAVKGVVALILPEWSYHIDLLLILLAYTFVMLTLLSTIKKEQKRK